MSEGNRKQLNLIRKCAKCDLIIAENKAILMDGNILWHSTCFICVVCQNPIGDGRYYIKENNVFCEIHSQNNDPLIITQQPNRVQVASYNIQPNPKLTITVPFDSNETVQVQLIDNSTNQGIDCGFQGGDVRVLRAGVTVMVFSGLKLNKLKPIKAEINAEKSKILPTTFALHFKIGRYSIMSSSFKLVSSCSLLPEGERNLRPLKRAIDSERTDKRLRTETENETNSVIPSPLFFNHLEGELNPSSVSDRSSVSEEALRNDLELAIQRGNIELAASSAKKLASLSPKGVTR